VDIAHHQRNGRFGAASFRITFAAFETEYAEVPEFRGKISFRPLGGLKPYWRGTHFLIIASHSC